MTTYETLREAARTPRAMAGVEVPSECGKRVRAPGPHDRDTCVKDQGHKGAHRGYSSPACDICGQETRLDRRSVSYSCSHPGVDYSEIRALDRDWFAVKILIACVLREERGGDEPPWDAPLTTDYRAAVRIIGALRHQGLLEGLS